MSKLTTNPLSDEEAAECRNKAQQAAVAQRAYEKESISSGERAWVRIDDRTMKFVKTK